jgi:hypothetical protein
MIIGDVFVLALVARALVETEVARRRRACVPVVPSDSVHGDETPPVSVLIPARNEADAIASTLASVCAQRGLSLEITVVDDGSTDGTAGRARAALAHEPHARVVRTPPLPRGWTGKTHALEQGFARARGEWVLMLDADVSLASDAIARALAYAERHDLDALSLSPSQASSTLAVDAVQVAAYRLLDRRFPFSDTSRPGSPVAAASGAFFLVRRAALERIGGFASMRSAIVEDVALARALKSRGCRVAFLPAKDLVRVRTYVSLGEQAEGWTRVLAPLLTATARGGGLAREVALEMARAVASALALPLGVASVVATLMDLRALGARVHATPVGGVGALLLATGHAFMAALIATLLIARAARAAIPVRVQLFEPFGSTMLAVLLIRSAFYHRSARGVTWKGRVYASAGDARG